MGHDFRKISQAILMSSNHYDVIVIGVGYMGLAAIKGKTDLPIDF